MNGKINHYVKYRTKVVDVSEVNLVGWVDGEEFLDRINDSSLPYWLGKFNGKKVRILIEVLDGGVDESPMLKGME